MANSLPVEVNSDIYYCCDFNSFHDNYMCPYAHIRDVSELKKIDVRRIICSFNLANKCKYKKWCMFAHLNDSESEEDNNEKKVEPNIHLGRLDEPASTRELSSENVNSHLTQHTGPGCLELVNSNIAIAERLEHVLSIDENMMTDQENRNDNILEPKSALNPPTKESLENSDKNLGTDNQSPRESLIENWNEGLESMVRNTGPTIGVASTSNAANVTSMHFLESERGNETNALAQNQLEKESNNEAESNVRITTNESSVSQKFLLDSGLIASTSQSSTNATEELETDSNVSCTQDCGICQEVIGAAEPGRNSGVRFGILTNCIHSFCLGCIRQWRNEGRDFIVFEVYENDHEYNSSDSLEEIQEAMINSVDPKIARSCPICRVLSHFVVPSYRWVKDGPEKEELIASYKAEKSKINCIYFEHYGECRFGKYCFYLHAAFYSKVLRSRYNFEQF